jgi:hypothetical protein
MSEVQLFLDIENLSDFVTLYQGNAFEIYKKYRQEIDFLHVDISNDGNVLRLMTPKINCALKRGYTKEDLAKALAPLRG